MKKFCFILVALVLGLSTGVPLGRLLYQPQPPRENVCHIYGTIAEISPKTSDGYVITMDIDHSAIVTPSTAGSQEIHKVRILPDSFDHTQRRCAQFTVEVIPLSELSVGDTVELSVFFHDLDYAEGEIVWLEGHASVWEPLSYSESEEDGK